MKMHPLVVSAFSCYALDHADCARSAKFLCSLFLQDANKLRTSLVASFYTKPDETFKSKKARDGMARDDVVCNFA